MHLPTVTFPSHPISTSSSTPLRAALGLAAALALTACSSSSTSPDVPAGHAPFPLLPYNGGPLLTDVHLVTVTFANEPNATRGTTFETSLVASPYWKAVTGEYCDAKGTCIGAGGPATHVVLPEFKQHLSGAGDFSNAIAPYFDDGSLPAPTDQTLYVFYIPPEGHVGEFVTAGFHDLYTFTSIPAPFAVVNEDTGPAEMAAAHEIIEAATDPDPSSSDKVGWALPRADVGIPPEGAEAVAVAFGDLAGPEAADLCEDELPVTVDGRKLPRSWSNASVDAGHNPCVPIPEGEVYFGTSTTTQVLHLGVGESVSFEAVSFSEHAKSSWNLSAATNSDSIEVSFNPSDQGDHEIASVENGTRTTVKVTLKSMPTNPYGFPHLSLDSQDNHVTRHWPILVLPK